MTAGELHGRGAAWPLAVGVGGGIQEASGADKVEAAIRVVLGTQRGERLMRPTFGCDLKRLVFAPADAATANLARHYVEAGLGEWEPRIQLLDVTVEPDGARGALLITIGYRLRATQEARSLVYPFYLERP
jgi:phage baseplate assembly protein W